MVRRGPKRLAFRVISGSGRWFAELVFFDLFSRGLLERFFSIFGLFETRFKNDFEKTSKKVRKLRFLGSQNPPKMPSKSMFQKASMFSRFLIMCFSFLLSSIPIFPLEKSIFFWFSLKTCLCNLHHLFSWKTFQKPFQDET